MAELNTSARGKGNIRRQKASLRIDMTPMVDLGFLLITFFMLTAVLTKPFVLPVEKYSEEENEPGQRKPIQEKNLITVVLGENDKVYWFAGVTNPKIEATNFSVNGIRKILLLKKAEIKNLYVFIKATKHSRYQNLIDILDEMSITNITHYSIMDVAPEDEKLIAALKQ
jgi:biopolymer transport protein ExbD